MPPTTRKKPTILEIQVEAEKKPDGEYFSQSELDPNGRACSEILNDILYKLHRGQFSQNEINKLRTQLENSVTVR